MKMIHQTQKSKKKNMATIHTIDIIYMFDIKVNVRK